MRLFILLTFCSISLSAEIENLTNESCEDCQAVLPKKRVKNLLKSILYTKEHKIQQLKERETNSYTLISLNDKNQTIKELQYELALLREQLIEKQKIIISLKQKLSQDNQPILSTVTKEDTPQKWINITVNNDLNIYDLALKYYGDSQEYEKIYMANQNQIDKNYQIRNGMSLKIPITENFMK